MAENSAIAWTDHTFNPWWGCTKVSPACNNCYAETASNRWGFDVWGKNSERRDLSDANWSKPIKWDREAGEAGRPALVFCASMADVFEGREDLAESRARLWELIESTPNLIWLLLTKRPENVLGMVPADWLIDVRAGIENRGRSTWPSNVWVGTTVENQRYADERVPELLTIPAPVRFLSMEPLLGRVDLDPSWLLPNAIVCGGSAGPGDMAVVREFGESLGGRFVDWVIVGGESGNGFRPLDVDDALFVCGQVQRAGIPLFFKQIGGLTPKAGGDTLDGETLREFPRQAKR